MAVFAYQGRNNAGESVTGSVDAGSAELAAQQLLAGGIHPTQIKAQKQEGAGANIDISLGAKVKADELILLTRQLYSLTKAGVPLNQVFRSLSNTLKNRYLIEVLADIERNLNSGINLSAAMSRHIDVFPQLYVSIILVGENSGKLDQAFKQLVDHLEQERDTSRRVKGAFRYPIFVGLALVAAIVVLNIWVIPVFADMFEQFNTELPLMTRILLGTSNLFVNYWELLLGAVLAIAIGFYSWVNREQGRLKWDAIKLKMPLLGTITQKTVLSRFCRSFAMMLSSGVPLIQAVELCSNAVGNTAVGERIRGMRRSIERGESLLQAIGNSELFTPLVMQMVAVGEQTGRVDEMLLEVAEFYDQEVEYDVQVMSARLEPILIVCMAAIVGVLALGIFLPMWDMFSVVQG